MPFSMKLVFGLLSYFTVTCLRNLRVNVVQVNASSASDVNMLSGSSVLSEQVPLQVDVTLMFQPAVHVCMPSSS